MEIELTEIEINSLGDKIYDIFNVEDGEILGNVVVTSDCQIAYGVNEKFWNKGIATAALRNITKEVVNPSLDVSYKNGASHKVATKVGYNICGFTDTGVRYKYLPLLEENYKSL